MEHRLPVIDLESGEREQKAALLEWAQDRGQTTPPGDIWGMLVASPEGMRRIGRLGAFARMETMLPLLLRESAVFVAVLQRGFRHEVEIHKNNLRRLGVGDEFIASLRQGNRSALPDGVRQVAGLSLAMAHGHQVDDAEFSELRKALGDKLVAELTIVIGYYLMLADIAKVLWPGG